MNAFRFAMTSFDSKMAARCGKKLCRVARCLSTSSFAGPNACHVASRASANSSCGSFASRNMANWFGPSQSKTQSAVLSRGQEVYELQVHNLKADRKEEYLAETGENLLRIHEIDEYPLELIGSWSTLIGSNTDQITHLWKYNGFAAMNQAFQKLKSDETWTKFLKSQGANVISRSNQIALSFTYWPPLVMKKSSRIYEMRSYMLKPGSLIEWGEWWSDGIRYRIEDEAVGGWFSQVGVIHQVHHLWAYADLMSRKEARESSWEQPGWDEVVRRTVPLIQSMESRILVPNEFSPLQ